MGQTQRLLYLDEEATKRYNGGETKYFTHTNSPQAHSVEETQQWKIEWKSSLFLSRGCFSLSLSLNPKWGDDEEEDGGKTQQKLPWRKYSKIA